MTAKEKLDKIVEAADEIKAEQIETLDVGSKTSIADYFVVCTGTSDRHVDSIADRIADRLREAKEKPYRTEGGNSGWILQDFGDVIVHVMREEQRQFYDLESLWKNAQVDTNLPR